MRHSVSVHPNNKKEDLSAWTREKNKIYKKKIATESIAAQTDLTIYKFSVCS